MASKNTICLWYDGTALDAATFYAKTFPDSAVGAVLHAPGDYPSGRQGDVLTVEFTVMGIPCLGPNGGPAFKHSEAFSFQVATDDQAETDRLWNAIIESGGQARIRGHDGDGQDRHRGDRGGTAGAMKRGRRIALHVRVGSALTWINRFPLFSPR